MNTKGISGSAKRKTEAGKWERGTIGGYFRQVNQEDLSGEGTVEQKPE